MHFFSVLDGDTTDAMILSEEHRSYTVFVKKYLCMGSDVKFFLASLSFLAISFVGNIFFFLDHSC